MKLSLKLPQPTKLKMPKPFKKKTLSINSLLANKVGKMAAAGHFNKAK